MPHGQRESRRVQRLKERDADLGVRGNRLERDLAPLALPPEPWSEFASHEPSLSAGVQLRFPCKPKVDDDVTSLHTKTV